MSVLIVLVNINHQGSANGLLLILSNEDEDVLMIVELHLLANLEDKLGHC